MPSSKKQGWVRVLHGTEGGTASSYLAAALRRQLRLRSRYNEPCIKCGILFSRLSCVGPSQRWCGNCLGPDKASRHRLRKFNVSHTEWLALKTECSNRCEICSQPPDFHPKWKHVKELSIDHDHATGKVRGLLCWRCNLDLEIYVRLSESAPRYLERSQTRDTPNVKGTV